MEAMPSSSGADCEDWISRLLQQGPHELSLDALGTDPLNVLMSGQSLPGLTQLSASDQSSQSQLLPPKPGSPCDTAMLDELDLPELVDLLDDPFWQELDKQETVLCPPDCTCEQVQPQQARRTCKRTIRRAPDGRAQVLSSWGPAEASSALSDTATPGPASAQPQSQQAAAQAQEYPTSSQDSSHRPTSPAEALKDTSCTPVASADQTTVDVARPSVPGPAPAVVLPSAPSREQPAQPPFQFGQPAEQLPGAGGQTASNTDSEEVKRAARMQRNRESAHYSRQRKKMQTNELERRCQELQAHNTHLMGLVNQLTAEVGMLRHQLVLASTQGGMHQMHVANPLAGQMPGPFPYAAAPVAPAPTAKVPIQKLKPSRPAPAPTTKATKPQSAPAPAAAAPPRPSKRARTASAAAGAAAVLALCTLLVVNGPVGTTPQGARHMATHAALPMHGPGRTLQALTVGPAKDANTTAALGVIQEALEGANATDWGPLAPWQASSNASAWGPVALHPFDKRIEALTLQQLKDLAPVAMISDWSQQAQSRALTSSPQFRSFSQLAGSVMGQAGLLSPAACREVFSFDVTSLVDPLAARASLKRHLASLATFRGRSLGPLPLPPIGGSHPPSPDDEGFGKRPKQTIGCGDDSEVVVSIMLPRKQPQGNSTPSLTSLDQIFVVMLKPGKQYTTYSCSLDKPVFA